MSNGLYVTDTHPLVYYFCGRQNKLGKKALKVFEDAAQGGTTSIFVSPIVLWEFSNLLRAGKIKLKISLAEWIEKLFAYRNFNEVIFDIECVKTIQQLELHSDPFDRAIVATAMRMDLPLITNDQLIHQHKLCKVLWD